LFLLINFVVVFISFNIFKICIFIKQNIIERFPASLVQEPTAFTSNDAMELYNNILVFIVSGGGGSRSEMHIFQVSCSRIWSPR